MAVDKKISQLASGAPAQAGDEYVVARSGANYKLTLTNIAASMPPIGATTPNTGSFTSLTTSSTVTVNGGTANQVQYLDGSKVLSGSANLTFNGTTLTANSAAVSTGNLTFSSTGQRITGDFSNATVANRVLFQTSVTNGNTEVGVMPNGTGAVAGWNVYGTSSTSATTVARLDIPNNTETRLLSGRTDASVSFIPMTFYTGGSERMRLDTSGRLGIGVSPAARLDVADVSRYTFNVNAAYTLESSLNAAGSAFVTSYKNALSHIWQTSGSDRMTLDSSGNVGIGGTAAAYEKISVSGTYPTSSNVSQGFVSKATIPSGATSSFVGYYSVPSTQAAAFTCTSLYHFLAGFGTKGASSAITNQYGFLAGSDLTGATSNFGFYSDIASGSNRWNFYANGTAANYFAGDVGIGTAPLTANTRLSVLGGRTGLVANSEPYSIYVQYGSGKGQYYIGATDSASIPDLVFSNISGTERMRVTHAGNVVAGGSAALATNATDGFLYVPTCAGTPTGTPTAITGMAPIVVDTTNHKLYFYSGGTWRDAGP